MILLLLLLLVPNIANATVWYVRSDGGTNTQCTGTTDAAYDGSGTGEACALNHPHWVIPNRGQGSTATNMAGGDTVVIHGPEAGTGVYRMGCQDTANCRDANYNLTNGSQCDSSYSYDCSGNPIPDGSSGSPSTIIGCSISGCGTGTLPILWSAGRNNQMININGTDYITIKDIELTDHAAGVYNEDSSCNSGVSSLAGLDGIYANSGSNLVMQNVNIHGFCRYGMRVGGFNNVSMTDVTIHANGWSGWSIDSCSSAGTCGITGDVPLTNNTITYNGCAEEYPVVGTGEDTIIDNGCHAQADGVIADGIESADMAGDWVLIGNNISWNTHDGPDLLYHNKGTYSGGTIVARRNRFEGNGGNSFKSSNAVIAEDNLMLGNCGYFTGNRIASLTWSNVSDSCRAQGNAVAIAFKSDVVPQLINNTILSNGDVGIETSGTCTSGTDVLVVNNIMLGGRQHNDDTAWAGAGGNDTASIYYNSSGTCAADFVESYNICYNWKEGSSACNGTGSTDTVNPLFVGDPIPMGPNATVGYYGGVDLIDQVYLQSGSPARSAGTNSYGDSTDYNSYTQTNPYTQGALVYGSTPSGSTTVSKSSSTNGSIRLIGSIRAY